MREIIAIDPDETWEVDFCLESARRRVEFWEQALVKAEGALKAKVDAQAQAADAKSAEKEMAVARVAADDASTALASARADLAGYQPGTGPVFVVGHVPAAKAPELGALARAMSKTPGEVDRARADFDWTREVVRWAIRNHRSLKKRGGGEVVFETEDVQFDGAARKVVSRRTLELYAASGLLTELAIIAITPQRLPDAEKNA